MGVVSARRARRRPTLLAWLAAALTLTLAACPPPFQVVAHNNSGQDALIVLHAARYHDWKKGEAVTIGDEGSVGWDEVPAPTRALFVRTGTLTKRYALPGARCDESYVDEKSLPRRLLLQLEPDGRLCAIRPKSKLPVDGLEKAPKCTCAWPARDAPKAQR